MANIRCDLKNIRPRPIRGFLGQNKVIFANTEIGLPVPYIIKAMHQSDVYVNGKLVETFQQAADILKNIYVAVSTPEDFATKLASIKEGDIVELSAGDYTEAINIDKPCIIKGNPGSNVSGTITVTAPNVVLDGLDLTVNNKILSVQNEGDVTLVGCGFTSADTDVRTAISICSNGQVVLEDCVFDDTNGKIYNTIEFDISGNYPLKDNTIIRNCKFRGKPKNNSISIYSIEDNANILIENCYFEYSENGIRISNPLNANATFTIKDCKYDHTSQNQYAGLLFFQDYSKEDKVQDFTKIKVNINNLIGPNGKVIKSNVPGGLNDQVYYVYDDQDGIITDHNQPIVNFA